MNYNNLIVFLFYYIICTFFLVNIKLNFSECEDSDQIAPYCVLLFYVMIHMIFVIRDRFTFWTQCEMVGRWVVCHTEVLTMNTAKLNLSFNFHFNWDWVALVPPDPASSLPKNYLTSRTVY